MLFFFLLFIFKSVLDLILFLAGVCLFSQIPDCKDIVAYGHISKGGFIQWQQMSSPESSGADIEGQLSLG